MKSSPVYKLLGGKQNNALPLYHSMSCMAPAEMVAIAQQAHSTGIRQFQLKLSADNNLQIDVQRLTQVREPVGTGPPVYGDWNCGASQLDAIRVARAIAHLDVMLEQPCTTLNECVNVKNATGLPKKLMKMHTILHLC